MIRKLILPTMGLIIGLWATQASAALAPPGDLGTLNAGGSFNFGNNPPPGSFIDLYLFKVNNAPNGAADAASVTLTFNNTSLFAISGLNYLIRDVTNSTNLTPAVAEQGTLTFAGLVNSVQYALRVSGTAIGTAGGTYAGNLSVVPVPAAVWLFGSAFLGLCWLGRRAGTRVIGMLPAS